MASRVTKLFLQAPRGSSGGDKAVKKLVTLRKAPASADATQKPQKQQTKQKTKKSAKKAASAQKKTQERFLDAAKRELAQADRTRENVRKLRVKPTPKAQRLMAQALAQRRALLR